MQDSPDVSGPPVAQPQAIPPAVWRMAAAISLAGFMSLLDTTIVNVALRTIDHRLHSTLSHTQWIITGYLLATAATLPIAGWAVRRCGARSVFLTSLVLFTAGSALCAAASSVQDLIAFRVLQGIGGAALLPVGQSALTKRVGSQNVARMMGVVGGPMFLAPILGPTIGGALVDGPGWRWIFLVNLPIGAIAILIVLRYFVLDEAFGRKHAGRLDLLGLILLSAGLVGLMLGISEVAILNRIDAAAVLIPFGLGIALTALFLTHARRTARPLLDLTLYRDRAYSQASMIMAIGGAAIFGSQIDRGRDGPSLLGVRPAPRAVPSVHC